MKVVYASDENYFAYIYVSVLTLLESNKDVVDLQISYIWQDVCVEKRNFLKKLGEKFNRNIEIREFIMPDVFEKLPFFANSKTTFAKLIFASMYPDDDVVLFVDPDTLVLDNIENLFKLDFGDNLIAGVTECLPVYHKEASHMFENDQYINGGMVLCNLKKWREENFEEKALDRAADTRFNLNYDQGIINDLCKGRILMLPPRYNVLAEVFKLKSAKKIQRRFGFKKYYTQNQIDEALTKPAIIHFTGFLYGKPLSSKCTHPYSEYFWKRLKECPWKVELTNKDLNSKQKLRRFVLDKLPFFCFLFVESILDLRRKWLLTKE